MEDWNGLCIRSVATVTAFVAGPRHGWRSLGSVFQGATCEDAASCVWADKENGTGCWIGRNSLLGFELCFYGRKGVKRVP
ncbi:hypothetical protein Pan216_13610 [Planctomycetes bacterium Pan216]|uniref:Uncharacterized protein n=1 Tax=Kolteria novifilia TaxID=2527975 RepID=A0A518B0M6_9BACT|nr:hypothetical protein Pan216_13610 [Planctomycetes bacterium Pan216]